MSKESVRPPTSNSTGRGKGKRQRFDDPSAAALSVPSHKRYLKRWKARTWTSEFVGLRLGQPRRRTAAVNHLSVSLVVLIGGRFRYNY